MIVNNKGKFLVIGIVSLFILGHTANGSELELSALIEEAKSNNPELQAMSAEYEAAGYGISWPRYLPDPLVAVEFSGEMTMYSVTQQIPFLTKITKRYDLARLGADQKYLLYEDKKNMLIRDVKEAYAAFLLLKGKIGATEKSISFLKQIHGVGRQKYSINEASQAEVLIAEVELARAENELSSLHDDLGIVESYLNTLLNRDLDDKLELQGRPVQSVDTLPLSRLYELAITNRPQLRASELKRREAQLALSVARQSYLPDLVFRYTHELMIDNMSNSKYMVGLSVPIWFWGKQDKMIREAHSLLRSASARYELMENVTLLDVKEAKVRIDKYRRTVQLYGNSILPQAETALKSALAAYKLNRIDFHTLLESEKSLVQAEYAFEEAYANLFMATARLEQIIGYVE
ncbi:TolC family protein [candidate division WOR-3 bacterium]|nr:TolC family protein [candidate division WOR-3 bacterium]